jgi:hypothetical protein
MTNEIGVAAHLRRSEIVSAQSKNRYCNTPAYQGAAVSWISEQGSTDNFFDKRHNLAIEACKSIVPLFWNFEVMAPVTEIFEVI